RRRVLDRGRGVVAGRADPEVFRADALSHRSRPRAPNSDPRTPPVGPRDPRGFGLLRRLALHRHDREYAAGFGRSRARVSEATRLPDWIKERRHDVIRVVHAGSAFLTVIGLGLVMVVSRPVSPTRCPGPFAPGAIAAILTGGFALALATGWILLRA